MASLSERLAKQASGQVTSRYNPLKDREQSLAEIPLEQIKTDPGQPRKNLGDIESLAASIKEYGVFSPIIVQAVGNKEYQIIAGERRYTASKVAGLKAIPCVVRTIEEHRKFEYQLIENLHRKDLNPVEEALSYKSLVEDHNISQRELSRRLGQSASGINQTMRILDLPEEILEGVQTSEHVTKSILLEIVKERDSKKQIRLWKKALDGTLTVRSARKTKKKPQGTKPKAITYNYPMDDGTVSIRFEKESASHEEQIKLLRMTIKLVETNITDNAGK